MDTALIEAESVPLRRRSLLPGAGFFYPDDLRRAEAEAAAETEIDRADVTVVADGDADGLTCAALIRIARGEAGLLPTSPHDLERTLERIAGRVTPETELYICDLCPDDDDNVFESLATITETAASVTWYDHHQWDPAIVAAVRDLDISLVIGDSDTECTADVAFREIDHDFSPAHAELVELTRDHDLWLREDPRSDDVADYAYYADPEEFVATAIEYGAAFPDDVRDLLREHREEKAALIDLAVGRASMRTVGSWTVGVTYGRCSQNEVAEALREQGADAAIVVKPAGSASIRGSETFEQAHEVAGRVGGGGHPRAAGCKPDIYDDMLDYAYHWTTEGAAAKRVLLAAFRAVATESQSATQRSE